jgi:hypothetical protein
MSLARGQMGRREECECDLTVASAASEAASEAYL